MSPEEEEEEEEEKRKEMKYTLAFHAEGTKPRKYMKINTVI